MSETPKKIKEMMTEIDKLKENFRRIKSGSEQWINRQEVRNKKAI
ncbi:MAG TPA: hypothetical protein PLU43_09455 [Lachnospiraceae bacterium]|nr:hypothetical protein [Lachnospiraceae bacterium]